MFSQGEIVLIPIPFTNLESKKKRPVMILSNGHYNKVSEDIIAVAITSNIRGLEYEVVIENQDMIEGNLKRISCIRTDKIYTLSKDLIVTKFGKVNDSIITDVKKSINILID